MPRSWSTRGRSTTSWPRCCWRSGGRLPAATTRFAYGVDDGRVRAAALRTTPWSLLAAGIDAANADDFIAAWLPGDASLDAVSAEPATARAIAAAWSRRTGGASRCRVREAMHILAAASRPARPARGRLRLATESDRALLVEWIEAFYLEAGIAAVGQGSTMVEAGSSGADARLGGRRAGIVRRRQPGRGRDRADRTRLHAARAPRPRLCEQRRRGGESLGARIGCVALHAGHGPRQPDIEPHLREPRVPTLRLIRGALAQPAVRRSRQSPRRGRARRRGAPHPRGRSRGTDPRLGAPPRSPAWSAPYRRPRRSSRNRPRCHARQPSSSLSCPSRPPPNVGSVAPVRSRRGLCLALLALAGAVAASAAGPPATVWLCRPGVANDPCIPDGGTSVVSAKGASVEARAALPSNPRFDCFYVYPTVSAESRSTPTCGSSPPSAWSRRRRRRSSPASAVCGRRCTARRRSVDSSLRASPGQTASREHRVLEPPRGVDRLPRP